MITGLRWIQKWMFGPADASAGTDGLTQRFAGLRVRASVSLVDCHKTAAPNALRLALLLAGTLLVIGLRPAVGFADSSLSWSRPTVIDREIPFSQNLSMNGVSCASASLCVAVDQYGNVVSSTDPGAGAAATWSIQQVENGPLPALNGISCVSSLCVGVGDHGRVITSADPQLGAMAHWTAGQLPITTNALLGVSCTSPSLCVRSMTAATFSSRPIHAGGFPRGRSSTLTVSTN